QNNCYAGVSTYEWIVTLGGDGFFQAIEPGNPDIVYSAYQYGNIYRFDKKSRESIKIRPEPVKGEDTYKWNWNAPFILSPHSPTRLYMAANKVFRSDDRGQSWTVISEDITTQTDRNTWPVMGRYWGVDAVAKDVSTSLFGTGVSLAESLIKEDLVYVGTDDGVIQVTEDAGKNWTKITSFPGVPEYTFVSDILPDRFDENTVYASFDNIQRDDFKPYLLKSTNKGKSWESITANLPANHTVLSIAQDFVDPDLLFIGTEFGVFFTIDGGKIWTQMKSGLPTIKVPDIVIQERECDLVIATFGRGFYILDNYAPLRELSKETRENESYLFPVKDALMFTLDGGYYGQGSNFFYAPNPAFGATFTYYLKEVPKTLKEIRKEQEKALFDAKKPIPIPTMDELRAEENQIPPYLVFTIKDLKGNTVRKISASPSKGTSRITWDLRHSNNYNVDLKSGKFDPYSTGGSGILAMPGKYSVSMAMLFNGEVKDLAGPVEFEAKPLNNTSLPNPDRAELVAFQDKVSVLINAVNAADEYAKEQMTRVHFVKQAIQNTPDAPFGMMDSALVIEKKLDHILWALNGQKPKASDEENWPAPPPVKTRLDAIMSASYGNTYSPTKTQKDQYALLEEELPPLMDQLKEIGESDLKKLEMELDKLGAPWTPGRIPEWKK
ncbi:MAG: glycosyl hydrolase, partial [Bacteroidales bacterium]|nr:glycosyl hydrolase [Bacteroidales bacterium]